MEPVRTSSIQASIELILKAHSILHESTMKCRTSQSHNELERGRRAHLRQCMDELKSRLNRLPAGTRLTTLVILKAAKDQLHFNRQRNNQLKRLLMRCMKDRAEASDRLKKKHLEVEKIKLQLRRNRCSGSECSIATTLSEESDVHALKRTLKPSDDIYKKVQLPKKCVDSGYGSPEQCMIMTVNDK